MKQRSELHNKLDRLGDAEALVVEQVIDAELTDIESTYLNSSWLVTDTWAASFSARLRAHHALNPEPIATSAFEAAFNEACRNAGFQVVATSSATHRFFDTTIITSGGLIRHISLKSSSARDIREDRLHISKLTEAAWIQDTRRQRDRQQSIITLFQDYRAATDAIVMLRIFPLPEAYRYQLVEIDTSLFDHVDQLSVAQAQQGTINFPIGRNSRDRDYAIRIDKSDAKITVTAVDIERCVIHGEWIIPNLSGVSR